MRIVRCNWCGNWIGNENDLDTLITDSMDADGRYIDYEQCPECGSILHLADCDELCFYTDKELIALWILFGDVPINNNDAIEEEFLGFPVGTNRFDIWKWFDGNYSGGVISLMENVEIK